MMITCSNDEAEALMKLTRFFKQAPTPVPFFLRWVADRLVRSGDDPNVDFVQALRDRAGALEEISRLLGVVR